MSACDWLWASTCSVPIVCQIDVNFSKCVLDFLGLTVLLEIISCKPNSISLLIIILTVNYKSLQSKVKLNVNYHRFKTVIVLQTSLQKSDLSTTAFKFLAKNVCYLC